MATPLVPQEIFVLERYASAAYVADLRDVFGQMVSHAERCLDAFLRALPPDYRRRPVHDQPDVVWGERVLPNFRTTLHGLDDAVIRIRHDDLAALAEANGVRNDAIGFARDHSSEWMDERSVAQAVQGGSAEFWRLLGAARSQAANVVATDDASWATGELTALYDERARGPTSFPIEWPRYRPSDTVRSVTGQPVPRSGVYLPACDDSVPAFLVAGRMAPQASVGRDPKTTQRVASVDTAWALVERRSDFGGGRSDDADPVGAGVRLRCAAGEACPRSGFWSTVARIGSRATFAKGDTLPDVGGDYGETIWQWDDRQ